MALNSPSIRRFNTSIISNKPSVDAQVKRDLPDHYAAFLAAGGQIDVIPGFTEIKPRPVCQSPQKIIKTKVRPSQPKHYAPDNDEWRTIPDYWRYHIATDGRIKNRGCGQIIKGRKNGYVVLTGDDGKRELSRKALVKLAWGEK